MNVIIVLTIKSLSVSVSLPSSDWDCQETKHHLCTSHSLPLTGGECVWLWAKDLFYAIYMLLLSVVALPMMRPFSLSLEPHSVCLCVLQHQQQVVQAVERAKQVTMAELNAVIGVRGLPGLPPTVCIPLLPLYLYDVDCLCMSVYSIRNTFPSPHIKSQRWKTFHILICE